MRRLIDTHAHLSDLEDAERVIQRAKQSGVDAVVAVSANTRTCIATLSWAEAFPGYVFPALGIHPNEFSQDEVSTSIQFIEEQIDVCVAVGEIGLDYWSREAKESETFREWQRNIYVQQLQIAAKQGKPVSVHSRGSWRDALNLAKLHGPDRIVFHWYSGPLDILSELLDSGYQISATPATEYSMHHRVALSEAPLDRILIETDSPVYLRNRSRRSEPSDLRITVKALADLKEISQEEVAKVTSRNAEKFFHLP